MKKTLHNIILVLAAALVVGGCEMSDGGGMKMVPPGTVTQSVGKDAALKSLSVENFSISPAFDAATLEYTLVVAKATTPTLTVHAIGPEGAAVTVRINGDAAVPVTGMDSGVTVTLSGIVEVNDIVTSVTSEDGLSTAAYHIRVYYLGTSASLSGIAVSLTSGSPGAISSDLSPSFDPMVYSYAVGVAYSTTSIDITVAMPEGSGMTASVGGWTATSGVAVPITNLSAPIVIEVNAQDGLPAHKKTYTITVSKDAAPSTEARLDYLQLKAYSAGWYTLDLGATTASLLSDFGYTKSDTYGWSRTKYKILISPIDNSVTSMTAKVFSNDENPHTSATPLASGPFTIEGDYWIFTFDKDAFDTGDYPYDVFIYIVPESGSGDEVIYHVRIDD